MSTKGGLIVYQPATHPCHTSTRSPPCPPGRYFPPFSRPGLIADRQWYVLISDDDKDLIYQQVAASKEAAEASRREAKAVEIRNALLLQISEDTARLIEPLQTFIAHYSTLASAIAASDEKIEDLHARQAVIDRSIKLILELERAQLGNIRDKDQRKELEDRINEAQGLSLDGAVIKRRLAKQVSNLNFLQEQAAEYGSKSKIPLELFNDIADIQEAIQELQSELRRTEE